jgi:iron complex transport system substrate-binding protein
MRTERKLATVVGLWLALTALWLPLAAAAQEGRAVVDETGRTVQVPARVERIVSLAPNLTEIVFALGLEEKLVGVTSLCDFPAAARAKPRVGDVLNPSLEKILELKPDVVLGSTAGNRRETVEALERLGVPLYGVEARSVGGILESIRDIAELAGDSQAGAELAEGLQARLVAVEAHTAAAPAPRVLFALWLEPLVTIGHNTFLDDVLARAGAESVTADLGESWPRLSVEEVIRRDPDYLILPRTHSLQASFERIVQEDPWRRLRAVREDRVVWLDDAVLRPGPRIVDAIEELSKALHPEAWNRGEKAQK